MCHTAHLLAQKRAVALEEDPGHDVRADGGNRTHASALGARRSPELRPRGPHKESTLVGGSYKHISQVAHLIGTREAEAPSRTPAPEKPQLPCSALARSLLKPLPDSSDTLKQSTLRYQRHYVNPY
jgi:hypothetical protein